MGTRSLTIVQDQWGDGPVDVMVMYRQMDGYVGGHGHELADFLARGHLVNGIRLDNKGLVFNGMGCLAAQVVAHFKDGPGSFYLHPSGTRDTGEEYRYFVRPNEETPGLGGKGEIEIQVDRGYGKEWTTIFLGSPVELQTFGEAWED